MFYLFRKKSGAKQYGLLTADDPRELARMARRLKEPVHGKGGQEKHLDLSGHKITVAIEKYGAIERKE